VSLSVQKAATFEKIDAVFEKIDAVFEKIDATFGKQAASPATTASQARQKAAPPGKVPLSVCIKVSPRPTSAGLA